MKDEQQHTDDNAVIPFKTWVERYSGVSEATARRICAPGGSGPQLIQLSARRLGVRYGDHKAWIACSSRSKLGLIYVIGFGSCIKIGHTTNLKNRLTALQTGLPEKLTIFGTIPGGSAETERRLHRRFKKYRMQGEWFRREGRLAEWIAEGCEP